MEGGRGESIGVGVEWCVCVGFVFCFFVCYVGFFGVVVDTSAS